MAHPTDQTEFGAEIRDRESALVTFLTMAEAFPEHALMLHADLLLACFALVALGLIPGAIVGNNGV